MPPAGPLLGARQPDRACAALPVSNGKPHVSAHRQTSPLSFRRLVRLFAAAATCGLAGQALAQSAAAGKPAVKFRHEKVIRSILYMCMYVALHDGYFKDAGLDAIMKTSSRATR